MANKTREVGKGRGGRHHGKFLEYKTCHELCSPVFSYVCSKEAVIIVDHSASSTPTML
jgi:hypothetical protein